MLENVPSPADREISLEATLCAIVAIAGVARVLELAGFDRATLAVLVLGVIVSAGLTTWHLANFRQLHRKQTK